MGHMRARGGLTVRKSCGVALAAMLFAGTVAAQTATTDQQPAKTGTPFWDDATVGYMFRTASFNRSSSGDPSVPGLAFKQTGRRRRRLVVRHDR